MALIRRSRCPVCGARRLAISAHNVAGAPCYVEGHEPLPPCHGLLVDDGVLDTDQLGDETLDDYVHGDKPLGERTGPILIRPVFEFETEMIGVDTHV